jgi:xanthine dehydrogenase small subunit
MAGAIRFILNGRTTEVAGISPSTTVLDWLRGEARLTGTKEGCAEGDCGACTIAVADLCDGKPRWQALNACLMLVPQLDGCWVLTVEGLKGANGELHPVQQALVESHGTQCGFCTPGFVMAMFAFHHGGEAADDDAIHDALAGNLCRCTGYRPIVDAMRKLGGGARDEFARRQNEISADLERLQRREDFEYGHRRERFFAPREPARLAELRTTYPKATLLGGGTDLGLLASKDRERFPTIISLARVRGFGDVGDVGPALQIGGAATYSQALPHLERRFPAFAALVRRVGSRQIRNLGTIAGNLGTASPIGDTLPCLIALGAEVEVVSHQRTRATPVEAFITGYRETALRDDEVISSIRIPHLADGARFFAYKISKRFDQDISAVIGAFRLRLDGSRVAEAQLAFGGMADRPKRASAVESALVGRPWTGPTVATAATELVRDFSPIGDFRASAEYRLTVSRNLLRRMYLETTMPDAPMEVAAL